MNKKVISLLLLLTLWLGLAVWIDNEIILPGPWPVAQRLFILAGTAEYYKGLAATFIRAHLAFGFSFILGLVLALAGSRFKIAEEMLTPWIKALQTIPQISFIILLLFWFSQAASILLVVILMAFPIAYFNALEGLKAISQDHQEVLRLSSQPWWYQLKKAYLPLIKPSLLAAVKSGLPLSLKVTVMSEVLIHTPLGIGRMLSLARANIDMVGVFAWTFSLVLLVSLETHIISYFFDRETWK